MPTHPCAIIEAPSTLGLATEGVELLSDRLLDLGLADRIQARRAGRLTAPPKDAVPDPKTDNLNAKAIAARSPKLADAVEAVLDAGEFRWCSAEIVQSCWARCWRLGGVAATAYCSSTEMPISFSPRRSPMVRAPRWISPSSPATGRRS